MTRIVLHIDRLLLRGIDRNDAAAVAAGVEAELRRLLSTSVTDLSQQPDRRRIDAGRVDTGGDRGERFGAGLAGAIVRSIGQ
ncbi:MAG: hypothetical protein H6945_08295 [Zoogloeaceae bacterium]|nr:hypothetical protein [Rhodocyclaceae bacterium]MCP5235722.1 hypothetical protein [Zoogloeaceae bacterium]